MVWMLAVSFPQCVQDVISLTRGVLVYDLHMLPGRWRQWAGQPVPGSWALDSGKDPWGVDAACSWFQSPQTGIGSTQNIWQSQQQGVCFFTGE